MLNIRHRRPVATLFPSAAALACLVPILPAPALAEGMLLDEIVVSPTRSPLEAARTGSSVTVIDREDLDAERRPTLLETLERVPGVSVRNSGGPGTVSDISIRGFGSQDVILRIDGIELADPGELQVEPDFAQVLTGDARRIEVLKGAQSALYGGEAVGGVIDVTTGVARGEGTRIRGFVEGGSFATVQGAATLGHGAADWDAAITVQGFDSRGISARDAAEGNTEEDGYSNVTVSGTGSLDLSDDVTIGGAFRHLDRETEFDGFFGDVIGNRQEQQLTAARGFMRARTLDGEMTHEISAQALFSDQAFFDVVTGDFAFQSRRIKAEYLGTWSLTERLDLGEDRRLDLIFGGDWTREDAEVSDGTDADTTIAGGFVQAVVSPVEPLTLTGSLRLDRHSEFGNFVTWRATAAYAVAEGTVLRGSAGTGFRAPSPRELFTPGGTFGFDTVGNPDLEPEETISWEIGIDQVFLDGRATASATYFESRTDELIGFDFDPATPEEGYVQVPGTTTFRGAEFALSYRPTEALEIGLDYTLLDVANTAEGERLPLRPRHDVGIGLRAFATDRLSLAASLSYVADRVQSGESADDFVLLDAQAAYAVTDTVEVYLRGANLLDQDYQLTEGFGTPGIAVFGGVRVDY